LTKKAGCWGLASIRTGAYLGDPAPGGDPKAHREPGPHQPWVDRKVKCFNNKAAALAYQAQLSKGIAGRGASDTASAVLFTVEGEVKDPPPSMRIIDQQTGEIDPLTIKAPELGGMNVSVAFQRSDGTIAFWESMVYGASNNPNLDVRRHADPGPDGGYNVVAWCVVESGSKFRPHTVK